MLLFFPSSSSLLPRKERSKYPLQEILGFRISGMRLWEDGRNVAIPKCWRGMPTLDSVQTGLCRFFLGREQPGRQEEQARDQEQKEEQDQEQKLQCLVESESKLERLRKGKAVVTEVMSKLRAITAWMTKQSSIRLYASSLLIVFDAAPGAQLSVDVRMIDFGHVYLIKVSAYLSIVRECLDF